MPTDIVHHLLICSDNSAGSETPFEVYINSNEDIFITSQAEDSTGWWLVLKKEDWKNIKSFIDTQLKK